MANERSLRHYGSKWIRPEKRLAIHLRDDLTCLWCNIRNGASLHLDHCNPVNGKHVGEANNSAGNLITACSHCNLSRGKRSMTEFAYAVAEYSNTPVEQVFLRIRRHRERKLGKYLAEAKALLLVHGTPSRVLTHLKTEQMECKTAS